MITGFNTDIEHDGVVYHVQTEDKGLDTPLILSLVYSGGAILASKRSRYEDLIASGFSDEALSERLTRQHKLICAAIHAGRVEDLKRMSGATAPPKSPALPSVKARAPAKKEKPSQLEILRGNEEREALDEQRAAFEKERTRLEAIAEEAAKQIALDAAAAEEAKAEAPPPAPVIAEPLPPPPPARENAYSIYDQRRHSVMGEFPSAEEGLRITLLGQQEFRSGEKPMLKVMVGLRTGAQEQPVAKAAVSVKVLGTTFRPQLYSARTQNDGVAAIATQIPTFTSGRAAILIRVVSGGRETELRRVIHPG